jgi:hypothetical protein
MLRRRWWLAIAAAAATFAAVLAAVVPSAANAAPVARADQVPAEATGLGQLTGILPASNLTLKGAAEDLGVNYAPKLANIGISCPACVQTGVTDTGRQPGSERLRRATRTLLCVLRKSGAEFSLF